MIANNSDNINLPREILLASTNQGKLKEIRSILTGLPIKFSSLKDYPDIKIPPETGSTFAENALIKAKSVFEQSNKPVIADDSGLCIDYLNGEPGVRSARFAGENASDSEKNQKVLDLLQNVPKDKRNAQFVCTICLFLDLERVEYFSGVINGLIACTSVGQKGFGYDPIFYVPEYKMTMAQLGERKNKISHRAIALNNLSAYLTRLIF